MATVHAPPTPYTEPTYHAAPDVEQREPLPAASSTSAVSWAAVFAGAATAAALGLILVILGTGLGMTAVSPWANEGMSATAFGITTIVWLTVSQLLSSGMGGYLAGRLRTKWPDAARDEVFFRDTAHGFLSWAVSTLVTAALLTSAVSAVVGAGVQAGASVASGVASSAALAAGGAMAGRDGTPGGVSAEGGNGPIDYFVDTLFREPAEPAEPTTGSTPESPAPTTPPPSTDPAASGTSTSTDSGTDTSSNSSSGTESTASTPTTDTATPPPASATRSPRALPPGRSAAQDSAEVARIFMNADLSQPLPPEDQRYVAQIIAQRTGLTQQEAEQRVSQNYAQLQTRLQEAETQARTAADEAREATAYSALWLFVSLLFGAFVASLAATFGGRQRDA